MNVFSQIPYFIPFRFSSVDDDARVEVERYVPYNVAVYGIAMAVSSSPQAAFYHSSIQFLNYNTGDVLFDEPLQNGCLQADARTYWKLPSKWFIHKNDKIVCSLDSFDTVAARTYWITLLGHVVDADPNPGVQPFAYSFPISVGFQDNVSGTTTGPPFNQGYTGTLAKHMLHDFDIHAIVLDPWGGGIPDDLPMMSLQVTTKKRKFFDRFIIDGCVGGGSVFSQGEVIPLLPASGANVHGFPEDNILQYRFPQPERVCKGELVRVDISPAPTYIATNDIHSSLNQLCCMALIGNHIA